MTSKSIISILTALLLLCSCSGHKDLSADPDVITLSASVHTLGLLTKASTADLYTATVPSDAAPLEADIWFSTTPGSYPNTMGGEGVSVDGKTIDTHRSVKYVSGGPTTPSGINDTYLRYPSNDAPVYCVGLYPKDLWQTSDGVTATAVIDGTKDLMFAPQIYGSLTDKLNYKPQTYSHLLTSIKVRVRAEAAEAADTWGKLRSISVKTKDRVKVNLSTATPEFYNSGAEDISFTCFDGPDYTLSTTSSQKGSALVAPVVADGGAGAEYYLHVVCEHHSKDIPLSLVNEDGSAFSGSTSGYMFVVTLFFNTLGYIEGTVQLKNWDEEYVDLTMN